MTSAYNSSIYPFIYISVLYEYHEVTASLKRASQILPVKYIASMLMEA
jgi:hypothetical protein